MTEDQAWPMLEDRGECPMCRIEPEAGWIEMPNNGPIVPCILCNPKGEKPRPTE